MKTMRTIAGMGLALLTLTLGAQEAAAWGSSYVHNIYGTRGSWTMRVGSRTTSSFYVDVPANCGTFTVQLGDSHGGYGDADLYIGYGFQPSGSRYTRRSTGNSYTERISFSNPSSGRFYIRVYAYRNYKTCLKITTAARTTTNWRTDMLNRVNNYRRQYGRTTLAQQSQLQNGAQTYANSMATYHYYGGPRHHGYPDNTSWTSSQWVSSRIQNCGYVSGYGTWGCRENIAAGQTSVASVMTDWWNSSGHRDNMLAADMVHVGFGTTASSDSYGRRWVQLYGYRR